MHNYYIYAKINLNMLKERKMSDFIIKDDILYAYKGNDACVQIPPIVIEIGKHAFYNCTSLKRVELPSTLQKIKEYAFYRCNNLADIKIPSGVDEIGEYSFASCVSLKKIEIPNEIRQIQKYAFCSCTSLISLKLSNQVEGIGESAFAGCLSLTSLEIPSSVAEISPNAFRGCRLVNLKYITEKDESGSWWRERFGDVATFLCALEYYDASTKVVKYVSRNKKKCIDILVKYNRADLINQLLEKSAKISLDNLDELIEHASKYNNEEINSALLEYKNNHKA